MSVLYINNLVLSSVYFKFLSFIANLNDGIKRLIYDISAIKNSKIYQK